MRAAQPRASRGDQAAKRALVMTVIFVFSGFIGLLIGYYIVANVTPMGDVLNLGLPGLPAPKEPAKQTLLLLPREDQPSKDQRT